jgi:serine/threonine protein kinase
MSRGGGIAMDVAIKVLRPDLEPSSQGVQRLRDEGRLLGRLTHPTILRVYDLVIIEGRAALISEYVDGDDLARVIKSDDRPPPRAVFEIIAQVAAALDAAWSWPSVTDGQPLHLVHRDIKPDNIRLDPHGLVKLLDFGIAQASTVEREAETNVNIIMGSAQYLAPERMVQQEVGPESDVFALGCTLYEALAGEALFHRKSMRQMYLLMVEKSRLDEFVTERLDALPEGTLSERARSLLMSMVAYDKVERPSAADVAARCDAVGDSLDGLTLRRWARQNDWPPAPEDEGPLEGRTFTTAQPLPAPQAQTLHLRAPESLKGPPELSETITDHGDRAPVLGELDAESPDAPSDGAEPWSGAEKKAIDGSAAEATAEHTELTDPTDPALAGAEEESTDEPASARPSSVPTIPPPPIDDDEDEEDDSDQPTVQVNAAELTQRLREMGLVDDEFQERRGEDVPTLTMTVPSKQQQASQREAAKRNALASLENTSPDMPVVPRPTAEPELPDVGHDDGTDESSEDALALALARADAALEADEEGLDELITDVGLPEVVDNADIDPDRTDTARAVDEPVHLENTDDLVGPEPTGEVPPPDDNDPPPAEPEVPDDDDDDDDYEPKPGDVDLSDVYGGDGSGDVKLRVAPLGAAPPLPKDRSRRRGGQQPGRASVMLFSGLMGILVGAAVFSVPALILWLLAG